MAGAVHASALLWVLCCAGAQASGPSLAERWQRFVDHSRFEVVTQAYDVLIGLEAHAPPGADACAERKEQLAAARSLHPFSPMLARLAVRCAPDEAARALRQTEADELRDFLLREDAGRDALHPVLVLTEADGLALIEQLGGRALYARYQVFAPNGGAQLVISWEDAQGRERRSHFDLVLLWHLLKSAPDVERYPLLIQGLTQRYLADSIRAGNSVAELAGLTLALARNELPLAEAITRIEALALAGEVAAAFELLPLCLQLDDGGECAAQALPLVRAHAGRDLSEGMLVMALAAVREVRGAGGRRAVRQWLHAAEQRIGARAATIGFAQLWDASVPVDAPVGRELRKRLRAAAQDGDSDAMLLLAQWLRSGRLTARHAESPQRWVQRAADLGAPAAQRRLGVQALRREQAGRGWKLLEAAASGGDRAAQSLLATALERGDVGLPADPARALLLFRSAAEQGNTTAMRRLARAWLGGELGLQARPERAEAWYLSAAMAGHEPAALELAEHYLKGTRGLDGRATDGYAMLQELAARGLDGARVRLATALLLGQGVRADPQAALAALQGLEAEGLAAAGFRLGQTYEFGQGGVAVDFSRALDHYRRAAELGHPDAMDYYARALYAGRGAQRDRPAALRWWQRGVERRHPASLANLAWVRCSSPDPQVRDPQAGTRLVSDELQRRRSANLSDTLAACLAAAGRFDEAVAIQLHTLELASAESSGGEVPAAYAERLAGYQRGEAWRERD